MADTQSIVHAFAVGDEVECHHGPYSEQWLPAKVLRLEPYRGRPGYYCHYHGATEPWHCHSGWQPENCVRAAPKRSTPADLSGEP